MDKFFKDAKGVLALLPKNERDVLETAARAELARCLDQPEGFAHFYYLVYGRSLPQHALNEWIRPIYQARENGKGIVIEAFRGSSKSTTLTICWLAFRIGHEPHKSYMLVQANDEAARDSAGQVADIIAYNPGWRLAFPQVVPDMRAGWGATGYEVKRNDVPYREWRRLAGQHKGKDPTLVGLGYRSRAVIGKHPTGVLMVDDIHDEQNTRSARELALVQKVVTGTILPTATPQTWQVFVGTPWTENDILAYLKATGRYNSVRTPVLRQQGGKEEPVWPAQFPTEEIGKLRQAVGEVEFARMYLLDLQAASGVHLRREWLRTYPYTRIDPTWPVVMGVDYASAADELTAGQRDYFAVAIGRALPGGAGVVLVDGCREQLSQGAAQARLVELAGYYPTLQLVGVEAVGKGEEFFHLMLRTSRLPLQPVQPGGRSKGMRFERGMAPLFERGNVFLSDQENPFMRAFRDEWVSWPYGEHDDTLDAVYWMLYVGLPHLLGGGGKEKGRRESNPFESLRRR